MRINSLTQIGIEYDRGDASVVFWFAVKVVFACACAFGLIYICAFAFDCVFLPRAENEKFTFENTVRKIKKIDREGE